MATGMNHDHELALDTLHKNKSAIIDSVANQATPRWLSVKLQEEGMISADNASAIINSSSLSNEDKVNHLIQAVESKLRHGSAPAQHFQEFVEILKSEPALKDLAQKLQTEYYLRRISKSEQDEPENDDTEESKLIHFEERRRDLHGRTQTEQEWRRHQPCESRCPQLRCENCFVYTCCCGVLIVIVVLILIKGKIQLQFVLKRDTEQQITESSLPYGISNGGKVFMEQELLLWLSCFIICTPWILAHYVFVTIPAWKTTKMLISAAGCCLFVMVGSFYFIKDFECFTTGEPLSPALVSLGMILIIAIHLPFMCNFFKHFCLRLFIVLLVLTVAMVTFFLLFLAIKNSNLQTETEDVDIGVNVLTGMLYGILMIFAGMLPIYHQHDHAMYWSSMCLSNIGVVTIILLSSALLLKVSQVGTTPAVLRSFITALMLLLTNLVLLTATFVVESLPSNFKVLPYSSEFMKNFVVNFGIFLGIRNLLLEALVLWKTF